MKQFLSVFSALALSLSFVFADQARTKDVCIWELDGAQGSKVYIAGSVHMLTEDEYPLPRIYEEIYQKADNVVFEVPMDEMLNMKTITKLMKSAMYPRGKSLKSELSKETYKALMDALGKAPGMKAIQFMANKVRPGFLIMILAQAKMLEAGADPSHGLDMHFFQRAKRDGKPVSGLETVEFQIQLFSKLTSDEEEALVKAALDSMGTMAEDFSKMVDTWKEGNAKAIAKMMNEELEQTPGMREALLVDRNKAWIPQIEKMLQSGKNTLVIVGAGHLAGADSVIDLLSKRDIASTQLKRVPLWNQKAAKKQPAKPERSPVF